MYVYRMTQKVDTKLQNQAVLETSKGVLINACRNINFAVTKRFEVRACNSPRGFIARRSLRRSEQFQALGQLYSVSLIRQVDKMSAESRNQIVFFIGFIKNLREFKYNLSKNSVHEEIVSYMYHYMKNYETTSWCLLTT